MTSFTLVSITVVTAADSAAAAFGLTTVEVPTGELALVMLTCFSPSFMTCELRSKIKSKKCRRDFETQTTCKHSRNKNGQTTPKKICLKNHDFRTWHLHPFFVTLASAFTFS